MTPEERRKRLEQIEAYAKAIAQSVLVMDERRCILEPLVLDDDIRNALHAKFRNTYGARAYNHLVPLLGQDLIRDLARLYLDAGSQAASLTNLFRKASEPGLKRALRAKFVAIPNKWNRDSAPIGNLSFKQSERIRAKSRARYHQEFEKSFEDGWNTVACAMSDLECDPVAGKIKTFRDKYHAHLEMTPLGEEPKPFDVKDLSLTYKDILDFAERYKPTVFEFVRILTGNVYAIDDFSANHHKGAADMWRILAGVAPRSANAGSSGRGKAARRST